MMVKAEGPLPRVPPGQRVTERLPVLHHGAVPEFDRDSWTLRVWGLVQAEQSFAYDEVMAMPMFLIS